MYLVLLLSQKAQHLEELFPSLISDATRPPAQTTAATVAEVSAMIASNTGTTEGYLAVSRFPCYLYHVCGEEREKVGVIELEEGLAQ